MSALELARLWSKRPDWLDSAACHGLTDLFFPARGDMRSVQLARQVCAGCPVRVQCTEAGMNERFGVWGGATRGKPSREMKLKRQREIHRGQVFDVRESGVQNECGPRTVSAAGALTEPDRRPDER